MVLEAYMYGRPVIVSDIMPEREVVEDENLRFSVDDPDDIYRAIRYRRFK